MRNDIRPLVTILGGMLLMPVTAVAQEIEPAADADFGEVVQVHLVNVDVAVTDKRGHPVPGLSVEDFEILEDGRPVEVSHFSFIEVGALLVEAETSLPAEATPGHNPGEAADAEAEEQWLMLYVDNLHSRQFERNRSLRRLQELLREQGPLGGKVMLTTYDRALAARQGFTDDLELIIAGLGELETAPAGGDRFDDERRRLIRVIERSSSPKDALEAVRPFAAQARNELWGSLQGLEEAIRMLAGLPGRKSMLFVSGGLPLKPGTGLFQAIEYQWPGLLGIHEMMLFDQSEAFDRLARLANESDVTLHTLDVAGVRPAGTSGVEENLKRVPTLAANLDGDIRANLQLPLRQLADDTGGRAILNRNNPLPELEELAVELGTYYSLAYTPDRPADDRFHRIEVHVAGKKLKVRHRSGYRDKSSATRMSERLYAALAHGVADNPLQVEIEVGAADESSRGRFDVPLQVVVPLRGLAGVPQGEQHLYRFRLYLAAMDEEGGMSEVVEIPADLSVASDGLEAALDRSWRLSQRLEMRPGKQTLAVGVRDEFGLVTAFATYAFAVGGRG